MPDTRQFNSHGTIVVIRGHASIVIDDLIELPKEVFKVEEFEEIPKKKKLNG
jgi:hypothetical protein